MKESKLSELLCSFTSSEYKKFGDFVRSPFFNKSQKIILLYDHLKQYSEDFSKYEVSNEDISNLIYGRDEHSYSKVRSLTSDFVHLIERFLIISGYERNNTAQQVQLLTELNERGLTKSFRSTLKETLQATENQFSRDEDYYYNRIFLEVEKFNYSLLRNTDIDEEGFSRISENIDLFFILTKLNLLHFMSYHRQNFAEKYNYKIWQVNEVIRYIESKLKFIKKEHPIIYMKYLILMTIIKPDEENYFSELKKFVMLNHTGLGYEVLDYIFGALTNYCMTKCNAGEKKYRAERFSVYKKMEELSLFETDKYINYVDFMNVIIASLEVNKTGWAVKFFDKHKTRILPEFAEDTLNLARTQIYYHKKKYDEAIKCLNNVSYSNYIFYLRSKMMLSRIYYDKKDTEPIIYIIDAARHYLKRNKQISKAHYESFSKFFNYLNKLISLDGSSKSQIHNISEALKKETSISSKEWFLEKLKKLETV
jgi:hypothetical protein